MTKLILNRISKISAGVRDEVFLGKAYRVEDKWCVKLNNGNMGRTKIRIVCFGFRRDAERFAYLLNK